MKKVMSMLLVAVLCCGMLVGCGKDKEISEETVQNDEVVEESEDEIDEENTDENEMSPEEEAALVKEQQESLVVYADLIAEIEKDIPQVKVQHITGTKENGKDMTVYMDLQESKDATYTVAATLVSTKETLMNNNGITEITVFVKNQGETAGILMFQNENGSFNPVVNTL